MKRRQIFTALAIGVLSAALAGCGGSNEESTVTTTETVPLPQKTYNWKLVTSWPKNFPGLGTAPELLQAAPGEFHAENGMGD